MTATTNYHPCTGVEFRAAKLQEATDIFTVFDAAALHAVGMRHREAERAQVLWTRYAHAHPGLFTQVAVASGIIIGAALMPPPEGRTMGLVAVHPEWRNHGIGVRLADWLANKAAQTHETNPQARITLIQRILASDTRTSSLLRARGWRYCRSLLRMERALTDCEAIPTYNPIFTVRPVIPEHEMDALARTHYLAFAGSETCDPAHLSMFLARWKQRVATDPRYDPSVWFVAVTPDADGIDTIAGICLCALDIAERDDIAWISRVAVRTPWRRQGLGMALLQTALAELARRGKRRVGLNVVAGNKAAITLYTRAGMSEIPDLQFDEYELPICPDVAENEGEV